MKYNSLNDFFSKLYVINLDRRPDRYQQVSDEFNKIGAIVERIPGIDGKTLSTSRRGMRQGAYALLLKHIELIKNASINKYENIIIFEDDVSFVPDFNKKFNEKIKYLPDDWDLFYLGGNHILHVDGFKLITGNKNFKITKETYKNLNHELARTPCTYCAHALGIRSKIYDAIIERAITHPTEPIDNIYAQLQQTYNAYTFLPSLATQRGSFSDIEGFYVDYNKISPVSF